MLHATATGTAPRGLNIGVGLISVAQLTLDAQIWEFQGITEVYNLVETGNPNDHNVIPGNKKAGVSNLGTGPLLSQQWSIKP